MTSLGSQNCQEVDAGSVTRSKQEVLHPTSKYQSPRSRMHIQVETKTICCPRLTSSCTSRRKHNQQLKWQRPSSQSQVGTRGTLRQTDRCLLDKPENKSPIMSDQSSRHAQPCTTSRQCSHPRPQRRSLQRRSHDRGRASFMLQLSPFLTISMGSMSVLEALASVQQIGRDKQQGFLVKMHSSRTVSPATQLHLRSGIRFVPPSIRSCTGR